MLSIGNTHERAAEILFDPTIIGYTKSRGIHHLLLDCIMKCDLDLRSKLYDSIYLVGGNCNIKNFAQRLMNEIKRKVDSRKNARNMKIRSTKSIHNEKHLIPFIGGTLIAGNSVFQEQFITRKEFEEYGVGILFRRSLC